MKFFVILLALPVSVIMCYGCRQHITPRALQAYVNAPANGISQEQTVQQSHIQLQYIPADLQALSEFGDDLSGTSLKEARHRYDSFMYFRLTIENEQHTPVADTLNYFTFNMQKDLLLVAGKGDTIPCAFYQKIATGNNHRHTFIVVFEKYTENAVMDKQDFRFVYMDKVFGLPDVTFSFRGKDLTNIPQL